MGDQAGGGCCACFAPLPAPLVRPPRPVHACILPLDRGPATPRPASPVRRRPRRPRMAGLLAVAATALLVDAGKPAAAPPQIGLVADACAPAFQRASSPLR